MGAQDEIPNQRLVLGCLAVLVVCTHIGRALLPTLVIEAPLVLIALSPASSHLILVAPVTELAPFLVIATLRRALVSVLGYHLGKLYGERSLQWVEGRSGPGGRVLRWVQALFERFPFPMTFAIPIGTSMLAGMARLPQRVYLPVVLCGHLMWSSVFYYTGGLLEPWITPMLAFVSEHMLAATAITVGLALAWQLLRRRNRKPDRGLDFPGQG